MFRIPNIAAIFKGNPVKNVAVLRLEGTISTESELSFKALNDTLTKTFDMSGLTAVAICINSPGGSPVQSELIAKRIRILARDKNLPVITFIEDCAASGGYWLACAGDEIYTSSSSIVGSIGVISSSFGYDEAFEKIGIKRRVYTAGENKALLDPFLPESPEGVAAIKALQKDVHASFIDYVKERRGSKLVDTEENKTFTGMIWSGRSALPLGLVDGIGTLYDVLKEKYGENVKLTFIKNSGSGLFSILRKFIGIAISAGINSIKASCSSLL